MTLYPNTGSWFPLSHSLPCHVCLADGTDWVQVKVMHVNVTKYKKYYHEKDLHLK